MFNVVAVVYIQGSAIPFVVVDSQVAHKVAETVSNLLAHRVGMDIAPEAVHRVEMDTVLEIARKVETDIGAEIAHKVEMDLVDTEMKVVHIVVENWYTDLTDYCMLVGHMELYLLMCCHNLRKNGRWPHFVCHNLRNIQLPLVRALRRVHRGRIECKTL